MYCGYRRFFYLKIQKKYKTFFNVKNLQYTLVWREKKRMSLPPENKFFGNTIPFCSIVDVLLVICFTFITKKEKNNIRKWKNEWMEYLFMRCFFIVNDFVSLNQKNQSELNYFFLQDNVNIPIFFVSIFPLVLFPLIAFENVSTTVSAAQRNLVAFVNFFP